MIRGSIFITNTAAPTLQRIHGMVQRPRGLMAAAAGRVNKELRANFLKLNARGNKQGWPRSNFWKRAGFDRTSVTAITDTSATVSVASAEVAHKLRGGRITAKRGKFLSLPITAKAKAAGSPREGGWTGNTLNFIPTKGGGLLVEAVATPLRRTAAGLRGGKRTGGEAQYFLTPSVDQDPEPDTLPPAKKLGEAVSQEAENYLARELRRAAK